MALMDRVATLVRANLNDLLDKAENPEKMLKQVILDMENQFMQVKTQVAIALADLHLLEKKKTENSEKHAEWMRKAELAVDKKDDQLARAALERAVSFQLLADNYDEQIAHHHTQVESMKAALKRLELKLSEARAKADLLIVQHRRSRATHRTANAQHSSGTEHGTFFAPRAYLLDDPAQLRDVGPQRLEIDLRPHGAQLRHEPARWSGR